MEKSILYPSRRIINRFSDSEKAGDFAERYFRKHYFTSLGLSFRKIKKSKNKKTPDGWVLLNNEKIALAEIKLVKYQKIKSGDQDINTPNIIIRAVNNGIKQLESVRTNLPKIIYIIGDNTFFNDRLVYWGIFGNDIFIKHQNGQKWMGPKGLIEEKYNLFKNPALSAIICYLQSMDGYSIYLFQNNTSSNLPKKMIDKKHLKAFYSYDGFSIIKNKIKF